MKMKDFRWDLQLFSEEGSESAAGSESKAANSDSGNENRAAGDDNGGKDTKDDKNAPKYSDADLDRILNKKFAKWESKKQKEVDEAKKLADLTAEEKRDKEMQEMRAELAEFKEQANRAEMAKSARAIFAEKGVTAPDEIVSMLISDNAETTKAAVESYIGVFQKEVSKAVKEALKGNAPKKGGSNSGMTKEEIFKVKNRAERQRLIKENPNLFGI